MGVKLNPFESSFASLRLKEKTKAYDKKLWAAKAFQLQAVGTVGKNVGFQSETAETYKFWLPISLMPQSSVLHFFCF